MRTYHDQDSCFYGCKPGDLPWSYAAILLSHIHELKDYDTCVLAREIMKYIKAVIVDFRLYAEDGCLLLSLVGLM